MFSTIAMILIHIVMSFCSIFIDLKKKIEVYRNQDHAEAGTEQVFLTKSLIWAGAVCMPYELECMGAVGRLIYA